jgi:hypothetical protein
MENEAIKISLEDKIFETISYTENPVLITQLNLVIAEKKICGKAEILIKLKNKSTIRSEFYKIKQWGIITNDNHGIAAILFSQIENVYVQNSAIEKYTSEEE